MKLKHFFSTAVSLLSAVTLLSVGGMSVSAQRQYENCINNCGVYDVQGVLSDTELDAANVLVQDLSDEIDMYVAIYIYGPETSFSSDSAVMRTADDNYDELFNPQYGVDTDGILLLINNSTMYDYISTSGIGQLYFSNSYDDNRVDAILEEMWEDLSEGNTLNAIGTFCTQVSYYYHKGVDNDAYTYNYDTGEYAYMKGGQLTTADSLPFWFGVDWFKLIGMGLVSGVIVCVISVVCIKNSYKLTKALAPTNYISHNDTKFHISEDHFLRQYQTRTRISSSSGGGGGRSGGGHSHRSSGGHSHGGGGRRR